MNKGSRLRGTQDDGQVLPGLMMLMLVFLMAGMLFFQVGRAGVLQADVTTAADAAALAGAQELRRQLIAILQETGFSTAAAIDVGRIRAAAADYARRNGGTLTYFDVDLVAYEVTVEVDGDADHQLDGAGGLPQSQGQHGHARAVAKVGVRYTFGAAGVPAGPGGSPGNCPVPEARVRQVAEAAGVDPEQALGGSVLTRYNGCGNGPGASVSGLTFEMQVSLLKLERAMGVPLQLNSGFRTAAYQAVLCQQVDGPCAPPGRSLHQAGLAVDINNWQAALAAVSADPDLQLCQPLPIDDAVHFSHSSGRECGGAVGRLGPGQLFGGDYRNFATFDVHLVE